MLKKLMKGSVFIMLSLKVNTENVVKYPLTDNEKRCLLDLVGSDLELLGERIHCNTSEIDISIFDEYYMSLRSLVDVLFAELNIDYDF